MARSSTNKPIVCTARCEDCGNETAHVSWSPGTSCPHCGSHHFAPIPIIRRGSDYESADRSQGFAIEDIRFGRLAVWAEMISQKRLQMALHQQRQIALSGKTPLDLGKLLIKQKALTKEQVKILLRVLVAVPGNQADEEFAETAAKSGFVTSDKIEACKMLQSKMAREGHDAPPLPLLMHERRLLQENQIVALLKTSEQRQRGLLHKISKGGAEPKDSVIAALIGKSKEQHSKVKLLVALTIILFAIVFVIYRSTGGPTWATTECENCGAIGGAAADSAWPIRCSECEQEAVYPQAICLDCGARYISKSIGYGNACPNCKSTNFRIITNKLDIDKIVKEIESKKALEDAL